MKGVSLRSRLLLSFALVTGIGAIAFYLSARLLVPRLFEQRMGNGGMMGQSNNGSAGQHDAVVSAVNTSMVIALVAALVCSGIVAVLMSRRTLRSVNELRVGTARLAAGHYDISVARPGEAELAELADDINHLASSLATTEQRRASLIGDVAHEMRTPLTTIAGTLEGFDDGLFTEAELTDTVRAEVARLQRLAGDLAAASRADEGRLTVDRQPGDVDEMATAVVDRVRPRFDAEGLTLEYRGERPCPGVFDHERLVQLLTNLLNNAAAYTPAGGHVDVRLSRVPGTITLAVTDTGRGLDAHELERVFERFYRSDRNDHSGGTGIGLTISRAIARAHGGELTATSPGAGRGSTFTLTMPAE